MSIALALAACAGSGPTAPDDAAAVAPSTDATDESGAFVVNQALLRQARDEMAVLAQPASGGSLETLTASRPPRPVGEIGGSRGATSIPAPTVAPAFAGAATPSAVGPGASSATVPVANAGTATAIATGISTSTGTSTSTGAGASTSAEGGSLPPVASIEAPVAAEPPPPPAFVEGRSTAGIVLAVAPPAEIEVAVPTAPVVAAPVTAAVAPPVATTSATSGGITTTITPAPVAPEVAAAAAAPIAPTGGLPRPGEPGYIVSGHSTGGLLVASSEVAAVSSAATAVTDAVTPSVVVAPTAPIAPTPSTASTTAPVAGSIPPSAAVSAPMPPAVTAGGAVTPQPAAAGSRSASRSSIPEVEVGGSGRTGSVAPVVVAPTVTAALGQPSTQPPLPAVADVQPLDAQALDRGNFATLLGAMHGMVERCEPATQMREQTMKTLRAVYPVVDLDRKDSDNPDARQRFDEEFARSAAATLGSSRVNCDYVRSQSYGWNQLVGDLRLMNRDSARQYRPGLITEISRGAGIGGF